MCPMQILKFVQDLHVSGLHVSGGGCLGGGIGKERQEKAPYRAAALQFMLTIWHAQVVVGRGPTWLSSSMTLAAVVRPLSPLWSGTS